MLSGSPCIPVKTAALIVGLMDVILSPIGILITTRLSMNPHIEQEFNESYIHPEFEKNITRSVLMTALQGLILNEWMAFMIFYPPLILTFIVGLELLISVHQRNYCIAKLALILNYVLVAFLLILTIVSLANGLLLHTILPFFTFTLLQAYFLWIVFEYAMMELKYPSVLSNGIYEQTTVVPDRFYDDEPDLNL